MKAIVQEDLMGCGIACVACALNCSYGDAKRLFNAKYADNRGYFCRDIVKALNKNRLRYSFSKVTENNKNKVNGIGTIVFIRRNKKYPQGHYLIKTRKGFMNSWINFPEITHASAGFQKRLPGKAEWIIYSI